MKLVTVLNGRSYAEAQMLVDSAIIVETQTMNQRKNGTWLFMKSPGGDVRDKQHEETRERERERERRKRVSFSLSLSSLLQKPRKIFDIHYPIQQGSLQAKGLTAVTVRKR
jgi:hypothetical protein